MVISLVSETTMKVTVRNLLFPVGIGFTTSRQRPSGCKLGFFNGLCPRGCYKYVIYLPDKTRIYKD